CGRDGTHRGGGSDSQGQRPEHVAAGRPRLLQRPGEATRMRQGDRASRGYVDQPPAKPATERTELGQSLGPLDRGLPGGLRLRGRIARRARRSLKEDLELVTYVVTSDNGTHEIEDLAQPGGLYLPLGETVDLETTVHTFVDKNHQVRARLRIVRRFGEF